MNVKKKSRVHVTAFALTLVFVHEVIGLSNQLLLDKISLQIDTDCELEEREAELDRRKKPEFGTSLSLCFSLWFFVLGAGLLILFLPLLK